MTGRDLTGDGGRVFTLQELILTHRDQWGWSYAEFERRSEDLGHKITYGRWQQMATHVRMKAFPERDNIPIIAGVLGVSQTTVVLAIAKSLDLDVQWQGPLLAALMPAGTDQLSEPVRDAILAVIRATVTEAIAHGGDDDESPRTVRPGPSVLKWAKSNLAAAEGGRTAPQDGRASDANGR